ncbi:MAG: DUF99 family protein [Planctomycetes bacterium]|nr:DUF99 family protein [Planctomycetota bacterium]
MKRRLHTLAIDDAPFDKFRDRETWAVGVVMAGAGLVEGVLATRLPVDGAGVTGRLADWIARCRFARSLRVVLVEGLTIAGLSVIDLPLLARSTGLGVISVDRRLPAPGRLEATLRKLGWDDRVSAVEAAGPFHRFGELVFACAGLGPEAAREVLEQSRGRSKVPEGIRIAHLIGQALVLGESKGRA